MITKKTRGSLARKKGRYYIVIYYYDGDVRRSRTFPTGIPVESQNKRVAAKNERAAREKMQNILKEFQTPAPETTTVDSLFADDVRNWLQRQKNSVAASTYAGYSYATADIVDYFSRIVPIKTTDLSPTHIEDYIAWEKTRRQHDYIPPVGEKKVKTRTKDGAGIDNTIMRRISVIRSVLQAAKRDGRISRNPCAKSDSWIRFPHVQTASFDVINASEARTLLTTLNREPAWFQLSVHFGIIFGLRRSEVLGLRESDFDFSQNTVTIRNVVTQQTIDHKNAITAKPKTKASKTKRFVLPIDMLHLAQQMIEDNHRNELLFNNSYVHDWDGYLFRHPDGVLITPNSLTQKFPRFLKDHGLKNIRFHDLRHSCASLLYAHGINPKTIQKFLGHSQLATTMEIYTHIFADETTAAVDTLSDLLLTTADGGDEN